MPPMPQPPARRAAVHGNQVIIETAEQHAARALAAAYNQARREILDLILQMWSRLQAGALPPTPERLLQLMRQVGMLDQIDARLRQLERDAGVILRGVVVDASEMGLDAVRRELNTLPRDVRQAMQPFSRIDTALVERFLPLALEDAHLATGTLASTLRRELQTGILQGESFPDLVRRMLNADASIWTRGQVSAELGVRRMVIHANNAARLDYLRQARRDIPELGKQVVASIQANTTETCLRAHGQVRPLDDNFELTGEPRFADAMMHTPFHWRCRSAIAAWHPAFERGTLTTAAMRASAAEELARRRRQ